jgi:signal transduction histidine kinase
VALVHVSHRVLDRYRRLSLRAKFTVHLTALTILLFAVLIPAVLYLETRAALEVVQERGFQVTHIFAHASVQALIMDDVLVIRHVIDSVSSEPDVLYAMIVDPGGRVLAHSDGREAGNVYTDSATVRAAGTDRPLLQDVWTGNGRAYDFAVPIFVLNERRAVARVGISLQKALDQIARVRYLVLSVAVLGVILSLGVAAWQAWTVTRPVAALVEGARDIAAGNLSRRIRSLGTDEVGRLGQTFNQMAEVLEGQIRELQDAQGEIVRKTRLAASGEIASVVAHEVRNPLAAIMSCAQNLKKRALSSEDAAESLDIIQREANRLNEIVSDFLTFGRPRSPVFHDVDLHDSIDETLRALGRDGRYAASIQVVRRLEASASIVRADAGQLRQAFWNLFLNAMQAMGTDGTLTVETRSVQGRVSVMIRDTGPGIPPADLSRLFEPFRTTGARGTGLGLATVYRIVTDHGGEIIAESRNGHGTSFVISLPNAQHA